MRGELCAQKGSLGSERSPQGWQVRETHAHGLQADWPMLLHGLSYRPGITFLKYKGKNYKSSLYTILCTTVQLGRCAECKHTVRENDFEKQE